MPRLTDPWFEAKFFNEADPNGSFRVEGHGIVSVVGAQGVWLWCPCGYDKPEYQGDNGRPHAIIVPFANPNGAATVPPNFGPHARGNPNVHPRWTMSGTTLADLTLTPSIDIGDPGCWHGYITNGEVRR